MNNPDLIELYMPALTMVQMVETDPIAVVKMFAGSPLEWGAVAATLLSVIFAARQNVLTWPVGLVAVVLYGIVFYQYWLVSDMLLQGFFVVTQLMGWHWWLKMVSQQTGENMGTVFRRTLAYGVRMKAFPVNAPEQKVQGLGTFPFLLVLAAVAGITLLLVPAMTSINAALPLWDGLLSWASVAAQILLMRKIWQSWVLWVAIDMLAIGVYSYKELYPSAALYGLVLLPLAAYGLLIWLMERRAQMNVPVTAKRLQYGR